MQRAPSAPPELPGYDYIKPLGAGGFSDVFLYEQRLPRRKVAVKVLLTDDLSASNRAAFVAEANLMAQLSAHPYIVTIYHADVAAGDRPYFVMEYCARPSLAERYKREVFGIADALRTGVRLSSAIATAHGAGILHRDIKPANVLTNDYGWPALTDFGISSAVDDGIVSHTTTTSPRKPQEQLSGSTESQSIGMSVPWSPPEVFAENPQPDVRSDVFSLAATIHTLLAGRTPFEIPGRSNGTLDLIGRIERGAITPLTRDDVPRSLLAVLQKGMATRPDDRYASALDFARALQRVELELGYAPTSIEIPHLELEEERGRAQDGDETHVRSVATIAAQPIVPPRSAPSASPNANAKPNPNADADATRVRPVQVVLPDAPLTPGASPAQAPLETIVRPRAVPTPVVAELPTEDEPVSNAAPDTSGASGSRRRLLTILIGSAATVVIAVVIVAIVIAGGSVGQRAPLPGATSKPGESAVSGEQVPTPKAGSAKRSASGTSVTFTWRNPDAQSGDTFRWARAEQPTAIRPAATPTATVTGVSSSTRVCIVIYLVRGGKESPAPGLQECDPK